MKVLLASASPRRRELLKEIFPVFEVISPQCEEKQHSSPKKSVISIAEQKAECCSSLDYEILISADTVVVYKNKIIGKPKDKNEAQLILEALAGKQHKVFTGVCIKHKTDSIIKTYTFFDKSTVKMKKLTSKDIVDYIATGSPLDKAGAYGIQDGVVQKYFGSYTNIVGLPVEKLKKVLKKLSLI